MRILDACCGSRMFWFDRANPDVVFADIRVEEHVLCDGRALSINPTIQMDFRAMPFADATFKMIVFDPPHMKSLGGNSWMAKKYGRLLSTWQDDLREGFKECFRVLEPNGTLIFKWNEHQIKVREIIELAGHPALFGHPSGKASKTHWLAFIK